MTHWRFAVGCFVVFSIINAPLHAQEPKPDSAAASNASAAAGIERILNVIDLILEHHIDPPTRQEMLLNGTRTLLAEAKLKTLSGLSPRVSDLANRTEISNFLVTLLDNAQVAGVSRARAEEIFTYGILPAVPGGVGLISAKELKVEQQLQDNQYVGIGIALAGGSEFSINELFPNGPAAKAGAKPEDRIEAIDGKPIKGLSLREVVDRIRGPEGSRVTLVVNQGGNDQRTLTITRSVVPRDTVRGRRVSGDRASQDFHAEPGSRIAYVRLDQIGGSSVHELRQIEQRLRAEGMQALIIDLQNVESHDAHYAVLLADALLANGQVGKICQADRTQEFSADGDCLFQDWPLAVLVNERTSGAAEWLAAALQDNQRAVVVGSPTQGDAYVKSSFIIPGSDDTLTLPTGILERPSGKPLMRPLSMRLEVARAPVVTVVRNAAQKPSLSMRSDVAMAPLRSGQSQQNPWGVHPDYIVQELKGEEVAIQPAIKERLRTLTPNVRPAGTKIDPIPLAIEQLRKKLTPVVEPANKAAPKE